MERYAQGSLWRRRSLAALLPLALLYGCKSCQEDPAKDDPLALSAEGISQMPVQNNIALYLPNACDENRHKSFPAIFAHYLAQSFPEGTLLEDILANDI